MSSYELAKAVHHVYVNRDNAMAFKGGNYGCLSGFDLTDEEYRALTTHDFVKMWSLNVHPVLLFHLAAVLYPREWYIENVVPKIKGVPNRWYDYYGTS